MRDYDCPLTTGDYRTIREHLKACIKPGAVFMVFGDPETVTRELGPEFKVVSDKPVEKR